MNKGLAIALFPSSPGEDPVIQVTAETAHRHLDYRVSPRSLSLGGAKRRPEGGGPVMTEGGWRRLARR